MPPLNSRVWRRYGQLRIYVSADNDPVGWFDPRTGRSQLTQPRWHDEFWAAVRAECQRLLADGHISAPVFPGGVGPITPRQPPPDMPIDQPVARPSTPGSTGWRVTRNGMTWPATRRAPPGQRPGPGTAPRASAADQCGRSARHPHVSRAVRGRGPRRTHGWPPAQPMGRPLWMARPARSAGRPAGRGHRPCSHRAVRVVTVNTKTDGTVRTGWRIRPDHRRQARRLSPQVAARGIPREPGCCTGPPAWRCQSSQRSFSPAPAGSPSAAAARPRRRPPHPPRAPPLATQAAARAAARPGGDDLSRQPAGPRAGKAG